MSPAVLVVESGATAALGRELVAEAVRWGTEISPDAVEATADAVAAAERRLGRGEGPVVIVWPALARLREAHATALRSDLADGCELVLGPLIDGGFYLVALARLFEGWTAVVQAAAEDPAALRVALAAAEQAGIEAGLLRPERGLRSPADVRAALADPCLPGEVRALLSSPPSATRS